MGVADDRAIVGVGVGEAARRDRQHVLDVALLHDRVQREPAALHLLPAEHRRLDLRQPLLVLRRALRK
eukprot:4315192-Prymnesium_polylepis.2